MSAQQPAGGTVIDQNDVGDRSGPARHLPGLHRLAWASMLANGLLIVTGGLVRLTGSGLGCPTWPRCTDASWTSTSEMGIHGAIEFGNRTLTFVLVAVATATLVWGWRVRREYPRLFALTVVLWLGIPLQAVIGGITVRTQLNPSIVGIHYLISAGLVVLAMLLVERTARAIAGRPLLTAATPTRVGLGLLAGATAALLYLGTLLTGAGPHSGDSGEIARHELNIEAMAKAHAWVAIATTLLIVVCLVLVRREAQRRPAMGRLTILLAVMLAQGALGYYQYFAGVPVLPVAIHLFGSAVIAALVAGSIERGLRG
ncbi:cytochrome c oxidase assembly protein subunit 15 [Kineosphaera limosa]|uniref:Cytochrome oxidase assembly protein n=1 Tax=Kineosphaera limosa NBRC 100340 TaxID=1184609 RepID=K6WG24_9MICO|nr:COX15/CtaA family protein [Kineosphaera limosa]NYD99460.1 cytochrome c oxidase assembly protein subunit 15 [Kineosphaera limosa]GAB98230.1 hypothetical protein KILIM_114_00050 [Kineosphaera limosa NBRC 100340]